MVDPTKRENPTPFSYPSRHTRDMKKKGNGNKKETLKKLDAHASHNTHAVA
jgi:hypothetical protein